MGGDGLRGFATERSMPATTNVPFLVQVAEVEVHFAGRSSFIHPIAATEGFLAFFKSQSEGVCV